MSYRKGRISPFRSTSPRLMESTDSRSPHKGRFAPSPSGRMHLGNVFTALMSWLSVKSRGGEWLLRIEDLDGARSKPEWIRLIEDDLLWLGLEWDEGGNEDSGSLGPYSQSRRSEYYSAALDRLAAIGLIYPCTCTRAEIMATNAPHQSDGRVIYGGTCRPPSLPVINPPLPENRSYSIRLAVPPEEIVYTDGIFGRQSYNLSTVCGDFVLRRADGAWAYQLAVVVDDALMGVTEVMRGCDLLLSAAQQIYLYRLLGYTPPEFIHLPLMCNSSGVRLSKRDRSLSMEELRRRFTPGQLLGVLAAAGGLLARPRETDLKELCGLYRLKAIPAVEAIDVTELIGQ